MKLNKKTKNAIANKSAIAKASAKTAKVVKAETVKKEVVVKDIGERVALVSGFKGTAFRIGVLRSDNSFKLTANHNGRFDGAIVDSDSSKWDKETRLQIGNYVASKGARVKLEFMTVEQALKLANTAHKISRNGHEITIKTMKGELKQYNASVETFTNKTTGKKYNHFFQYKTKKLDTNALHFGALIS